MAHGQTDDPFAQRLAYIGGQLELLSDSLSPGLSEPANFSVSGSSIQVFLRTLAESHGLNIQIDPSLNITLTNNFTSVPVRDIIYFLCEEYRLDIRFTGTILSFTKYQAPFVAAPPPVVRKLKIQFDAAARRVSFDLQNDSLRAVVKELTRLTDRNVIANGGVDIEHKLVTGFIRDLPLESALDKLAYTNGLRLTRSKDDVFILENAQGANTPSSIPGTSSASSIQRLSAQGDINFQDSLITLDVVNYPILEIINQVSTHLGINYILFSEIAGNTTAKVKRARYTEMLSFLFQGTTYTYKKRDGVYLIGQRTQEGFRVTEMLKLNFRTIEGIEREIPSDMMKEMEVKIVKELNAFIVTGNKHKIDELFAFIKLIDQPIPNILIEVIVAEVDKGFTLSTGIRAVLSADSVPKTGGSVFPGLDLTLSSGSINNLLGKLDTKGIANLGRVTPNFYATLKALEDNNNLQIRSTPKLSAMNGSKANLVIGQSTYYSEQTQNITGGVTPINSTTQRFNKVEANMSITISPLVSGNEHITLDIAAEFSDFVPPTIPNAPPGNTTRKFESKIRVQNEEMIILGGMEQSSRSENGSGVPFLSRIPVLKWFFSYKEKTKRDYRLIVFIKPTLVY
jgi:type IV pilus assembly protein PilQ